MIRSTALTLALVFGLGTASAVFAGAPAQTGAATATKARPVTDVESAAKKADVDPERKRKSTHERLAQRRIPFYSDENQFDEMLLHLPQF